jgi:glucose 1-dehydrogenase
VRRIEGSRRYRAVRQDGQAVRNGRRPINNAGWQKDATFADITLAQWQAVIDVNLSGQILCAREPVREFMRRGMAPERSKALGKIVCMSSVHEVIPWSGHVNYASRKGGILMMMNGHDLVRRRRHDAVSRVLHGRIAKNLRHSSL